MGYYMRFFLTDGRGVTETELETALSNIDESYEIVDGELRYNEQVYGVLEINHPGDGLFEDEISEFMEFASEDSLAAESVRSALKECSATVALQVLDQGRSVEHNLDTVNVLWEWLFANRKGLLQADGEGFYDDKGLIFECR